MSVEYIRRPFLSTQCRGGKRYRLPALSRLWRDLWLARARRVADPAPTQATRIEQTVFDFAKKKDGF